MKTICPFCKNPKSVVVLKSKKYTLVSCSNCSLEYLVPMPTSNQIKSLYQEDYFKSDKDLTGGYSDYHRMEEVLKKESRRRIKFIKIFTSKNKLLDIGCSLGTFLTVAKDTGFDVSGNDISAHAQRVVKSQLKIPFYLGPVLQANLPQESFDIVTAWDVFEHIPKVSETFRSISKTLKPGGFLFLTTPNIKSWDSLVMGKYWYGYKKIPEHLVFFSPQSIKKILEANGFNIITVKTWGFERDFKFLAQKASLYIPGFQNIASPILNLLHIQNRSVYLPLTDMIVTARKT